MTIGDVQTVADATDVYYVDTGMYDAAEYGSVYVIDGERTAVVDSGTGGGYDVLTDGLEELGIDSLDAVVLTHVHLDHTGCAGHLLEDYPDAQMYVHERGARHLIDPDRLVAGIKDAVGEQWQYYAGPVPVPEERLTRLADGDKVGLGDRTLTAHEAPGHAPHQHVFHDADAGSSTPATPRGSTSPRWTRSGKPPRRRSSTWIRPAGTR
jgi:glyoxylase-like metal-dependent hydrolase (beta-lactamase superfamily II)